MSNYLPSSKVNLYPSGFRGTDNNTSLFNPESRLTSEKNLTSGIRALTSNSIKSNNSKNSFVISNNLISLNDFEICIHGYIFNLDLTDFIKTGDAKDWIDIWAKIKLSDLEVVGLGSESDPIKVQTLISNGIQGTDNSIVLDVQKSSEPEIYVFTGLALNNEQFELAVSDEYQLHILTRTSTSNTWSIPKESKLLISTDRIGFDNTDKALSDTLIYEDTKGLIIKEIAGIESSNNSTIGSANKPFGSANISKITAKTISAPEAAGNVSIENIATNKIESTGTNPTVGTADNKFFTGYIDTLYADKIKISGQYTTGLTIPTILPATNNTYIGTYADSFPTGYINTLYVENIIPKNITKKSEIKITTITPYDTRNDQSSIGTENTPFNSGVIKTLNVSTFKLSQKEGSASQFVTFKPSDIFKTEAGTYQIIIYTTTTSSEGNLYETCLAFNDLIVNADLHYLSGYTYILKTPTISKKYLVDGAESDESCYYELLIENDKKPVLYRCQYLVSGAQLSIDREDISDLTGESPYIEKVLYIRKIN